MADPVLTGRYKWELVCSLLCLIDHLIELDASAATDGADIRSDSQPQHAQKKSVCRYYNTKRGGCIFPFLHALSPLLAAFDRGGPIAI